MTEISIYHNPRCSKSRQALSLIREKGFEPEIIEYLNTPLDARTLKQVLNKLGIAPRDALRTKEKEYKALGLDNMELNDDQIIEAIIAEPRLLERPIVIRDNKAAIGRPTEAILPLLD